MERKFKVGDIVKSLNGIGFVAWTENKAMGIKEDDCLLGIDLQTNSCGFAGPVKEEICEKSSLKDIIGYYKETAINLSVKNREIFGKLRDYEAVKKENELLRSLLVHYINLKGANQLDQ